MIEQARRIAAVCRDHGVTLPDAAVQFPLRHPAIVSAVLGARDGGQMADGLERYAVHIPDELWVELEDAGLVKPTA